MKSSFPGAFRRRFFLFLLPAVLSALLTGVSLLSAQEPERPKTDVRFEFDRDSQLYHVGENAQVTMTVIGKDGRPARGGMLYVRVTNDGRDTLDWHEYDLSKENPAVLAVTLSFPGHMLLKVTASGEDVGGDIHRFAGLSFDPEKIEPGLPKPDDFDRFWAEGKAEVRAIPAEVESVPIPELCTDDREVSQISFATIGGARVYGFLSKPVGKGPFPALVNVPGAGPGTGPELSLPERGFAVLVMNVFPYPVPLDGKERQEAYDKYNESLGVRYCYFNADSRDAYYFRPVYLGIDRAIDWLADQPFIDRNRIGYYGTSQGGGSALILSGLNRNIKAALSSVPAICDHAGQLKGRMSGWPMLLDHTGDDPAVLEASRYLDGVNFAYSIEIPIRVTVGFIDMTCSPSSVWSAYNVIPSADKQILFEQKLGHQNGRQYEEAFEWLIETVRNL